MYICECKSETVVNENSFEKIFIFEMDIKNTRNVLSFMFCRIFNQKNIF